MRVSTENNGSATNVSVALAAQPASLKPTFTSGCAEGDGTASCTVSSVSDKQPANLDAQIPVASGATSVTSVKLTATASIVTWVRWEPPSAAETVAVTAAAASASRAKSSPAAAPQTTLALGPVPDLNGVSNKLIGNGVSSSLIAAGNASSLFPAINPSATPNSSPGIQPQGDKQNAEPVSLLSSDSSALGFVASGKPGITGQVAGLIALALAVMLTVTRLSLRRRFRKPGKQGLIARSFGASC